MGLTPSEFWALTPWEFSCVVDGATERRHYEQETVARMTANLMNVHIAKGQRITPEQIYRRPDATPDFADSESFTRYMRERKRKAEDD